MKSCVIIGNPWGAPRDDQLRWHNFFPCLLYCMKIAGFARVLMTTETSYERCAANERIWQGKLLSGLSKEIYMPSSTGSDTREWVRKYCKKYNISHILYVGFTDPPAPPPSCSAYCLSKKTLQDGPYEALEGAMFWITDTKRIA